ncbi:MAG: CRTAC1 family protein [bacterium]|nr:CRTAC1 family protein [bacterium]
MAGRGICLIAFLALIAAGCEPESNEPPAPELDAASGTPVAGEVVSGEAIFLDQAATAGLDFTHWNGMTGKLYYAEMMGSGVALLDYDNDGDLDVYLVQGNLLGATGSAEDATFPPPGELPLTDRLFRNDLTADSEGRPLIRFVDVTEESGIKAHGYGMGVAAADFDNDGWTDLYVTNLGRDQILRNRDGTGFEDVTEHSDVARGWSVPAVALDYDRDGWLDLFVGRYVEYSAAANKRCTDELGAPNYCGPLAFAPLPDLLLHNRGDGTFDDASRDAGLLEEFGGCLGAVAADFDDDGWLDLYAANDGMPNQLWINREGRTFENRALLAGAAVSGQGHPEASMGVAAADFDRDGDEDLFVAHLRRETNTVYVNDGGGVFADRSAAVGLGAPSLSMTGFGTAWLDYDNDGWLDQMTVNGAVKVIKELSLAGDPLPLHQRNQLFRNRGDGSFVEVTERAGAAFELSEVSRGAAFGDLDNDGDTDVLVSNNSGPVRLLLNQTGQDLPWIGLRLMDRSGKRDLLGARAGVVLASGTTLWRRTGTIASYASSSDPRLLFGLGDGPSISEVVVGWPDGHTESWTPETVPIGAYTTLRQGTGSTTGDRR